MVSGLLDMASWFTVELDTAPPEVVAHGPAQRQDGELLIPYELSEPTVVSAEVAGGAVFEVEPTRLVLAGGPSSGDAILVLQDDVGNSTTVSFPFETDYNAGIHRSLLGVG